VLALACAALTLVLALPAPAGAVFTRPFIRSLSIPSEPDGVAVDSANNLYVLSANHGPTVIDKFDPAGKLVSELTGEGHLQPGFEGQASSLAVQNSTGNVYVAGLPEGISTNAGSVVVLTPTGSFLTGWSIPERKVTGVAVDNSTEAADPNSGDVLVAAGEGPKPGALGKIELFSPSGVPTNFAGLGENSIGGFGFEEDWAVATDAQGNIYVTGLRDGLLAEYSPSGSGLRDIPGTAEGRSVAIDPTNGHILVSEGAGVHEFDASGTSLNVTRPTSPVTEHLGTSATAVDSSGDLYVADSWLEAGVVKSAVEEFGPGAFLPTSKISAPVSELEPTSATLNGSVNPEGVPLTGCHFDYVTQAAFEATGFSDLSSGGEAPCVPAAGSIPVDSSFHPVHAAASGLQSGVTYRYELFAASDPTQLGGTSSSSTVSFTAPGEPVITSTSISELSSSFVDLNAEIDPRAAQTTYQFQYVDAADYEAAVAAKDPDPYAAGASIPATPAGIGAGAGAVSVSQEVGGLQPGSSYHFRIVAANTLATVTGVDREFTTLPAPVQGLPDGRAYELVTPPNKGDGEDMFVGSETDAHEIHNFDRGYSSESGNQFVLSTTSDFGADASAGQNGYVFNRSSEGWSTTSLAGSGPGTQSLDAEVFDMADFSLVGIADQVGSLGNEAQDREVNEVGPPGGPYSTLTNSSYLTSSGGNRIIGASSDLSHVVLASHEHSLVPVDEQQDPGSNALFESHNGRLSLVNVNSEGALLSKCGAVLGQSVRASGLTHDAVSADGSKVFFTAPDPYGVGAGCPEGSVHTPQLYVRENGKTTVAISDPPGTTNPQPAVFAGASRDGSRVFFVTATKLTADDHGGAPELYEYDTNTGTLVRVSRGESGEAEGSVTTVPAVAAEGSAVYFTSKQMLTSDAPFPNGGVNLYRFDTQHETTVYVATISKEDYYYASADVWWPYTGNKMALEAGAEWYTTPDGRYLVFGSTASVTGYNNSPAGSVLCYHPGGAGASSGGCQEIYRYDSVTGSVVCVSCDPGGAKPVSNAQFGRSFMRNLSGEPPRPVSDNGEYVFFETADALVPQDTNGQLDVYEWHNGTVSLISSGTDSYHSFFLDSSPDGHNVFFGTHARLVPADRDGEGDVYDARICEPQRDDPCIEAARGETAQCEGDACQNAFAAPIDQSPASLSFSGAGNVLATRGGGGAVVRAKPPSRAQKFAAALRACRHKRRTVRSRCRASAQRRCGVKASRSAASSAKRVLATVRRGR
jgi:hypothetical protein